MSAANVADRSLAEQCQPDEFANWTWPKWALIAGAITDGLISTPIYEKHGAAVLNTAQCGAITATINPAGLKIDCFRPMPIAARPRGN